MNICLWLALALALLAFLWKWRSAQQLRRERDDALYWLKFYQRVAMHQQRRADFADRYPELHAYWSTLAEIAEREECFP